jgi:hypothetical protein
MKTMTEVLKRQGALVRKIAAGTATEAERAEMLKLQEALDAAAAAAAPPSTATMTLAEFQTLAEADLAEIAKTPDEGRLARLQRNLKAIRDQGKTAPDDVVTVEVEEKAAPPTILDALDAAVDAATKAHSFDGRTTSGVREAPPAAPVAPTKDDEEKAKADAVAPFDKASVSAQIAVEALDALIGKVNALKALVATGAAIDREAFEAAFSGWWDLRSAIETFTAIAAGSGAAPAAEPAAATLAADAPAPGATDAPPPAPAAEGTPAGTPAGTTVDTTKGDWTQLSPRLDAKTTFCELRRGAMRVAGHNRATS